MSNSAITRSQLGIATYLAPHGPLVEDTIVRELESGIQSAHKAGEIHLVVDFANVSAINSKAIELLLDSQDALAREAGSLKLCNTNATLENVFALTGVDKLIEQIDSGSNSSDRLRLVKPHT